MTSVMSVNSAAGNKPDGLTERHHMTVYSPQSLAKRLSVLGLTFLLALLAPAYAQIVTTYTNSGSFTVPVGVTEVTVECWGGGGRGGTRTTNGGGAGGGGGAYARSVLTVVPGNIYTVTRGLGSTGTGAGGDSWFGTNTTILAKGGNSVANNGNSGATGGAFGSSIGDVRFAGGDGADGGNGTNVNGGGGGSSAGPSSVGTDATSATGATAPTGGGNGGNGKTGTQGDASDGSAPGGGGGGGKRTSNGTRDGGSGANGRVVVTYNPNGACMVASAANALPDNGCGSNNNRVVQIPISGLASVLGTNPGNARLVSVEVIVSHTWNRDVQIRLTAPTGAARVLVQNKFGNGDNLGNPASCPGSPMVFADGGAATTTDNTSNVVGTFAPEESLAGFTGNPNGTWTLTVCDNEAQDTGNLRYIKLNFCEVPEVTAATSNGPVCAGNALDLSATATGVGLSYAWTGTGTFSPNNTSANVTVTGAATGTYSVTATNSCGADNADVAVTVTPAPAATISYGMLPYCQGASNANVVRTGTAGGTYTASPAGLSLNASTGTVTLATSSANSYTVTYTVAAAGGCPLFSTTAGITVNATPTLYQDLDGDGFGDPATPTPSCTPLAGYVSNNTDDCPSVFGLIGSPCNDGNANTINDVLTGACICEGTNAPWYSQGSGSFTDPIWSHTINGPGTLATLGANSIIVVKAGHTISLGGAQDLWQFTVENGGTLALGSHTLTLAGPTCQVDGTLDGGTGNLLVQPTTAGTLSGSGTMNVNDLTVNASNGVACSVATNVRGTLQLNNGAFTASGPVQLFSNASGTGRLGPVAATASYVGNLTVNRFIPAGATNWRMLGSSVAGRTVNDLRDDFYTAGFPGSHSPNFANPVGSGILWPSVRWYNETDPGTTIIEGLTGATSTAQPLAPGQGFAAWSGTTFTTTTAFNVDLTGTPHVASTPIALPMSYTATGDPAVDGWNMVSNPLPSPILFSNISRGADVEDYITYFDPATGNNAVYDIGLGFGTNGSTNTIQSGQGFWLKANGSNHTTTVEENDKTTGQGGGFFGGDQVQTASLLRLQLSSSVNQFTDETVVVFSQGSPATTSTDVLKFVFAHPEAPQVATVDASGQMIAINAYGPYSTDISIPLMVQVAVNGAYTLAATQLHHTGLSCLRLEDLATGISTPLTEGSTYTFTALTTENSTEPRFLLHASAPLALAALPATCQGRDDGQATVEVTSGPVDITWTDADGVVLLEQNNVSAGPSAIVALEAGSYGIRITGTTGCGTLSTAFTIEEPAGMEVEAVAMPTSCPQSEDGTIDLLVLGGTAPFAYQWSHGANGVGVTVPAGTYHVVVTDANGCTFAPQEYVVSAGEGPEAGIAVESSTVPLGEAITFYSAGTSELEHSWDFGNGATSQAVEPTITYAEPGTYTVTLTVSDGTCTSTASLPVVVETSTGLPTIVGHHLNAWVSGDHIVVDHTFNTNEPVLVRLLSTNGQLVQEHRFAGQPARLTLPTADLATGIWLVRVSSGTHLRTFALPVLH